MRPKRADNSGGVTAAAVHGRVSSANASGWRDGNAWIRPDPLKSVHPKVKLTSQSPGTDGWHGGAGHFGIAGRGAEAYRPSLLIVKALAAGLGALSVASASVAILLAALPLVLFAARRKLTVFARIAPLVTFGVPVFFVGGAGAGSAANPVLSQRT